MATMKDVAKLASVSVATVSNYINQTKPLKTETKSKIKEAIQQLNYQPNAAARNLKTKDSNEIGVILPYIHDSYYAYIVKGIENVFQTSNFYVNIAFSNEIPEIEMKALHKFIQKNIGGVILVTCQPENRYFFAENFIKKNVPIVLIDRKVNDLDTNFVYFNNCETVYYLTDKLIKLGHREIGLIVGPKTYFSEHECIKGFKKAYEEHELDFNTSWVSYTNLTKEDAFRSTIAMLHQHPLDAIITSSESIAKGVLEAAYLRGIDVPHELTLLSLGQESWNSYSNSIDIINTIRPAFSMGEEAAKLLQKNMNSPILFEKKEIILKDKILNQNLELAKEKKFPAIIQRKNKYINVLMVDGPTTFSIKGLLPHFTNNFSIEANIQTCPQQYLLDRIKQNAESVSDEIDVYMFDIPWLPYLASNNYLMDISSLLSNESFNKEEFLPGTLQYFSEFEGKYFGVPFIYAPQLLFYRKDLFEDQFFQKEFERKYKTKLRPPRTWLEFNAIAQFFTRKYNPLSPVEYGISIAAKYHELIIPEFLPWLWGYQGKIINDNNKVVFNSPECEKAMENFCKSFLFAHPDTINHTIEQTVADFYESKTSMLVTFASYATDINNQFKSLVIGKTGYDFIPRGFPVLGGWSLGISPNSTSREEDFQFINWACGKEICNYYSILEGQSPLIEAYKNDELLKLYPWLPILRDSFQYCRIRRGPFEQGGTVIPQNKIEFFISEAIYAVLNKKSSIKEAIENAQKELEILFEEYGYPQ